MTYDPAFDGLNIPRYTINSFLGWRRLGPIIESYYGLGLPGRLIMPEYSVIVSIEDAPRLLRQIEDVYRQVPARTDRQPRLLSS